MGNIDKLTKEYMKDPVVFADAFNQYLYNGEQRIKPELLRELDTAEITVPYGADGAPVPEQKYRDVLKLLMAMTDGNAAYCIMGIESQADIHYAMPVKNGVYDFLQLAHQVSEAAKSHKKELKDNQGIKVSSDEYLSGFWKTDRLTPVVTLVIYFGADEWDAPMSLKDMYSDVDEAILEHVADYRVNLIAPRDMSDTEIDEFRSSLREVISYIKHSKDKDELEDIVNSNPNFRNIDRQAADVINAVTGSKLEYPEGKEAVDMCQAIEQMREESRLEGEIKGRLEGKLEGQIEGAIFAYKNMGMALSDVIKQISKQFKMTESESDQAIKQYWTQKS